jgi:hypothetical protein
VILPNYLVIGAQRSGTTWLHELLGSHPRIYVPTRRKEIKFFSHFYDRGLDWYCRFFPEDEEAGLYDAIGEVTPTYLYKMDAPARIAQTLPEARLLVILRNPADRAFSHYLMWIKNNGYRKSFEELLEEKRSIYRYGLYGMWLSRYQRHFDRSRFCILLYEESVKAVAETKSRLARFLGVDSECFPEQAGDRRVGESYAPRARAAFAVAKRTSRWLQRNDLDWPVNVAKQGVKRLLGRSDDLPSFSPASRERLLESYQEDMSRLEAEFELDLSLWR